MNCGRKLFFLSLFSFSSSLHVLSSWFPLFVVVFSTSLLWLVLLAWSLINSVVLMREWAVVEAFVITRMIVATGLIFLSWSTSSNTPTGLMVGTLLRWVFKVTWPKSLTFVMGIWEIPQLAHRLCCGGNDAGTEQLVLCITTWEQTVRRSVALNQVFKIAV